MIADAIRGFFRYAAESIDPIHPRDPALAKMFGLGSSTLSGVDVTHEKVAALPAVLRGVSIISNAMMKQPFYVFRETEDGHTWDKSHPSWNVVAVKPHPNITRGAFRNSLNSWAMLWGNAYAFIDRPNWPQGPIEMIPLLPDRTWPYRVSSSGNTTLDVEADGMLRYATRVGGEIRTLDASEVLHIRGLGPSPYVGWDIVELLKETFGGAIAGQQFGNRFYGQGANPSGFLTMDGSLDEEAEERFLASLRKATSGLGKSHKWAILEEGVKFQQLTIDPVKAQFLEGKQFDVRLLAMAIGIKVHKLIDGANSSYSSLEQANQEHKDDDLVPWVCRWREELGDKLLTEREKEEGTHSIDVDDEAMSWVPFRERASGVVELYNNGLIDKDEGRRKVNFGPSGTKRAKDMRIPANILYEDDAALIPVAPALPNQPVDEEDEESEETPPEDESKFAQVAHAYLGRIAIRLASNAKLKANQGLCVFEPFVRELADSESGPHAIQSEIDSLFSQVSAVCGDCISGTKNDAELIACVSESTKTFTAIAEKIIERMIPCTR